MSETLNMRTTRKEKFCYALGNAGANFIWTFTGSFLTLYYTDSVYIAAGFVGTMMVISRIFDGVSDILLGLLMEKTHSKHGKAWPWLAASILPLLISFILVFNVPMNISPAGQKVYITITYLLLTVVTFTIFNLAYYALVPRISLDPNDRTVLTTVSSIFAFLAGVSLSVATLPILNAFGGIHSANAWRIISLIYAVLGGIGILICTLGTHEKIPAEEGRQKAAKIDGDNLKKALSALLHSRYFYIAVLMFILNSMASSIALGIAAYYAKDVIGNEASYVPIALVYSLTTVISMMFCPKIIQKCGKKKSMIAGNLIGLGGYLIALIRPASLPFILLSLVIACIGGSTSVGQWTFSAEIVDYLEPRIGMRVEGLATSATSCGSKIGTGLGSAAIGWGLAIGGYSGELSVQPAGVRTALIFLFATLPAILCVARVVIMCFWDIDRHMKSTTEQ